MLRSVTTFSEPFSGWKTTRMQFQLPLTQSGLYFLLDIDVPLKALQCSSELILLFV